MFNKYMTFIRRFYRENFSRSVFVRPKIHWDMGCEYQHFAKVIENPCGLGLQTEDEMPIETH